MTYDPEWYLRDDHPDAEEHRKFLGIDKKGQPLAAPTPSPRRKVSARTSTKEWETLGQLTGKAIKAAIAPLEARIAELEARPLGLNYAGVWKLGASYPKHSAVSHGGSVWCARKEFPTKEPGEPNSGWQLACKRGRDGRDAK